jgi:hypothetical protein
MRRGLPQRGGVGDGTGLMRKLVFVSVILLSACGPKLESGSNEENSLANQNVAAISPNETSTASTRVNVEQANAPVAENGAESSNALGSLPPADAALRFVGLWATDKANCAAHGWRFTSGALTEPDGSRCSFYKVTTATTLRRDARPRSPTSSTSSSCASRNLRARCWWNRMRSNRRG